MALPALFSQKAILNQTRLNTRLCPAELVLTSLLLLVP